MAIEYIRQEIPDFDLPSYSGHRYEAMVPDTLDDCRGSTVPDSKSFTGNSRDENLTGSGSIKYRIPDYDIFGWFKGGTRRWYHNNSSSGKAFTQVIIGVSLQVKFNTFHKKCPETLTG